MTTINLPGHRYPVLINSVMWLEGEANYTRVHYQDGSFTMVTQPLQWFERQFNFIRVHKSAIVNPTYIREFKQKKSRVGWVQLLNGMVLPVSRSRLEHTAIQLEQSTNL
ncbi:LytR/AlgR family response regulator transcription factor [Spirosoma soli]|uniref:LytR/AlgR family response regulator transcription factor n=1 Tax=Spirosoma soli TaxID=1770529 RepID=A0ABW5LYK2_9BACT